ncbi:MAG: hypothetical protein JST19_10740 [Bacteroidetes bacterium]|nr:hypothetical protein [Bacteroidota bacterium]
MKRLTATVLSVGFCLSLISWGFKGHKAIATIAYSHLHFNVIPSVENTLHGQSISEVASWADEVRNNTEFRQTASWHFVNVPLGLNFRDFENAVKNDPNPNLYSAIIKCEDDLKQKDIDPAKREVALKFLIHLVGDAHQPMHVSRKEDKGGNTIQVRFDNHGTNLHSLWDSKLIDYEGLSDQEIVNKYDNASETDEKKWQSDDPIVWLWESYQISTKLYAEVESNRNIDQQYFQNHIGMVHQRIDQAGIRLAGILNSIFKNDAKVKVTLMPPPPVGKPLAQQFPQAKLEDVATLVGKVVSTKGKVYGLKSMASMTLVDLGAEYPNQKLTVVLKSEAKDHLTSNLLIGKILTVNGTVTSYKGKAQIIVTESKNISISNN